jgi:MFS family permease
MDEPSAADASVEQQSQPESPFAYRDFRLLWTGSFLSFTGSWIQNVAQGWLVYELTHNKASLGLVSFLGMVPVSFFGPFAGSFADMFNNRRVLIATQTIFALGALFLMAAVHFDFVQFWHILVVAVVVGFAGCIEMPTRQSIVSSVVPPHVIPKAVPFNAMTFNLARILGPAIGAVLLANFGAQFCYGVNGLSYIFLILAAMAIRTNLKAVSREPQPMKDLLFEGWLYTFRDKRLKMLFIMETIVATFGLFYISQIPAIVYEMLHLGKAEIGYAMSFVGAGAITGLLLLTRLSHRPLKALIVRLAMTVMGLGLIVLGVSSSAALAFPMLAIVGVAGIMQFNTTNTLFQLLSPEHLRGRVLAMHVWALSGVGPFGVLFFGWLASITDLHVALIAGGCCVLAGAIWGWLNRGALTGVE